MRASTTPDLLHNPFKNRFNDPVTWRLDEMQAHSNVVWQQQRNHREHLNDFQAQSPTAVAEDFEGTSDRRDDGGMFAGLFALLFVLLVSVMVLFRGF